MTLEQRLEKLERENRWMRRIGVVAAAVAAAVFLIGQGKDREPPDLVVRSLRVQDEKGKVRASLRMTADGAILGFYDDDGKMRIMLGAKGDRHSLKFIDTAGESRATFGTTAGFPALKLAEGSGTTRVLLSATPGFRGLYLRDKDDMPRAVLEMVDGSPTFKFGDAKGNVIWQAPR